MHCQKVREDIYQNFVPMKNKLLYYLKLKYFEYVNIILAKQVIF